MKRINLLTDYRGWISGRQLWPAGEYTLNEDAARILVTTGYAEYCDGTTPPSSVVVDAAPTLPKLDRLPHYQGMTRAELYQWMRSNGFENVRFRMKRGELIQILKETANG